MFYHLVLRPVVRSYVKAKPFLVFVFLHVYLLRHFKDETFIDPDKMAEKIFFNSQTDGKIDLSFKLTQI